jgi:D-3-phosphoglycerate dehydrogenase
MVVNAPQSNIVSAAEQAVALLLACARNLAPANAALKQGKWQRSKWTGVEVADKTVGVVGLGASACCSPSACRRSAPA